MTGLQIYGLIMPFALAAGAFTWVYVQHRMIENDRRAQENTRTGAVD